MRGVYLSNWIGLLWGAGIGGLICLIALPIWGINDWLLILSITPISMLALVGWQIQYAYGSQIGNWMGRKSMRLFVDLLFFVVGLPLALLGVASTLYIGLFVSLFVIATLWSIFGMVPTAMAVIPPGLLYLVVRFLQTKK